MPKQPPDEITIPATFSFRRWRANLFSAATIGFLTVALVVLFNYGFGVVVLAPILLLASLFGFGNYNERQFLWSALGLIVVLFIILGLACFTLNNWRRRQVVTLRPFAPHEITERQQLGLASDGQVRQPYLPWHANVSSVVLGLLLGASVLPLLSLLVTHFAKP